MHFTKMHGAGNDFIIINNMDHSIPPADYPELSKKMCAFHTGVGADGMMIVVPGNKDADFRMVFYNSDGTEGEMCGNGARCIARYAYEYGLSDETQAIETISGIVYGKRISASAYRVRLNDASVIKTGLKFPVAGTIYEVDYIELGNPGLPHAVTLLQDWFHMPEAGLRQIGAALRHAPEFPKGANVSFASISNRRSVRAVTFERGVEDFTLACGTGCGSIVSALAARGLVETQGVEVKMPGGVLSVDTDISAPLPKDIYLTGPTCISFTGDFNLN